MGLLQKNHAMETTVGVLMQTVKLLLLNRVTDVDLVNPDKHLLDEKQAVVRDVLAAVDVDGKNINMEMMQQVLRRHKHALDVDLLLELC